MGEEATINVLALHGFGQSKRVFEARLKKLFTGKVARKVNWVIPEANGCKVEGKGFGWWKIPELDLCHLPFEFDTLEQSVEHVLSYIGDMPIHGVLGFSQGTNLATILVARGLLPHCRFCVLFSACGIQDERYLPQSQINLPTIMVHGTTDLVTRVEEMKELAQSYSNANFIFHSKGHVIPANAGLRDDLLRIIN